jgi:hypothetical protein
MKTFKALMAGIALVLITVSGVVAEDTKGTGFASVDVMSNYVWRGQRLSKDMVVQPSVGIAYGAFSTNLWSNWDRQTGDHNETDLTLDYALSFGKLGLNTGYIYYGVTGSNTQEVYVAVSYDAIFKPKLTLYYDIEKGNGGFAVLALGHSFELAKDIPLNLGASAGYNLKNKVMGLDSSGNKFSGPYYGEVTAAVTVPVTKAISATPKIAYDFALGSDARDIFKGLNAGYGDTDKSNILYGGLNVTLSF